MVRDLAGGCHDVLRDGTGEVGGAQVMFDCLCWSCPEKFVMLMTIERHTII